MGLGLVLIDGAFFVRTKMIAKKIIFIEEIIDVPMNKDRLLSLIVEAIMNDISKEMAENKNSLTKSANSGKVR